MKDENGNDPLRLGDWWRMGLYLEARCVHCGAKREVRNLVQAYGDEARIDEHKLEQIRARLVCGTCGARMPEVEVRRRPEGGA